MFGRHVWLSGTKITPRIIHGMVHMALPTSNAIYAALRSEALRTRMLRVLGRMIAAVLLQMAAVARAIVALETSQLTPSSAVRCLSPRYWTFSWNAWGHIIPTCRQLLCGHLVTAALAFRRTHGGGSIRSRIGSCSSNNSHRCLRLHTSSVSLSSKTRQPTAM